MSGRYAFSMPEPRQRDGWFKLGTLDMTTTNIVVGLGLASMVLYAIAPDTAFYGTFFSPFVRDGELWRLVTWPLINPPSFWSLIGLVFFWYFGHQVEEQIGRMPQAVLLLAMTVIPAAIVTLLNPSNGGPNAGRWEAATSSVSLLSLGLLCIFAMDRPNTPFFFGIPAWIIAAVIIAIDFLQLVSVRAWAQIILGALIIVVACFGAAQRGLLVDYPWIPRVKALGGGPVSPYGVPGSAAPKAKRFGKGRSRGKPKGAGSGNPVVAGPWGGQPAGGPTPLEQAELDVLLDRISAGGIDSLTPHEKERLNALSKRMRDS